MKHKKIILLIPLFCLLLSLTSCGSIILSLVADKSFKKALYLKDTVNDCEVIILPMTHVGTEEHYARVERYLDSMKDQGFVTFYEGTDIERDSFGEYDTLRGDTLRRKMRKVIGYDIFLGYANPENKSMPKALRSDKYVPQELDNLGLVTDKDFNVDIKLCELIDKYESKYKPIILTDYDWQTDFLRPYKRENPKEHNSYLLLSHFRDDYIVEQILASEHKKIVVVYGTSHRWHINGSLQKAGFVWDRKFTIKNPK